MSTSTLSITMETQLKTEAESIFSNFGVSVTEAVNAFFRKTVSTGSLPFEIEQQLPKSEVVRLGKEALARMQEESLRNGNSEMTLEEINAVIAESRRERRERGQNEKRCA